jgi:hypothetical protein
MPAGRCAFDQELEARSGGFVAPGGGFEPGRGRMSMLPDSIDRLPDRVLVLASA